MGHYRSEMEGPYVGPTNEEMLEVKLEDIQSDWDLQKRLFVQGHQRSGNGDKYTCPQCFTLVNWWFLQAHDDWHNKLAEQMVEVARWAQPGLLG